MELPRRLCFGPHYPEHQEIKNQTILSKFKDGATAREIWSSLHARFERTNGILAPKARNRLSECKYTDGKDVQSHLDSMSKLWQEALAVGVRIEDTEFCHILRSSFPPSWAILIATLVTVEDPVSLEASLLAFADLRGTPSRPIAPTSSTALLSSTTKCTNCGKDKHTFEKCFRKGGGSENSAPHWWRTRNQGSSSRDQPRAKVATVDAPPLSIPDNAAFAAHHHAHSNNPFIHSNNPFTHSNNPFARSSNPPTSDYHLFVASVGTNTSTDRRVPTYANSGASHHYFVNRSDFSNYMEISPIAGQGAGKDSTVKIVGVGSVQKDVIMDGKRQSVIFRNVAHAPDLAANLVSISRLDADGAVILVENGSMVFLDSSRTPFMRGTSTAGNLYELNLRPHTGSADLPTALLSAPAAVDAATWHRRFGHIGDTGLQRLVSKGLVDGLDIRGPSSCSTLCLDCVYGKHADNPSHSGLNRNANLSNECTSTSGDLHKSIPLVATATT